MKKKDSPNIIDVAEKAGVSPATVSRVISRKDIVKSETAEKVLAAMEELQYEPENYASRKQKKTYVIAVIIPDLTDQFFTMLVKGIEDECRLHGYSLLLLSTNNSETQEQETISLTATKDIDGAILVPVSTERKALARFDDNKIHYIFLDRTIDGPPIGSVVSDDEEGSYQATKYLLDLGHKNILYIGGENNFSTERNRLKGFKRALRDHETPINPNLIRESSFHYEEAFRETLSVLQEGHDFSSIFAANDLIALGAKAAVEKYGKLIPEDISLIGYGDIPTAEYLSLTTVSMPVYEMGKNAFLLLLDYIQNRLDTPKQIVLRPSIVFRSTCKRYSK